MNEESQVRGCYNFHLHQPGNSVGSPLNQTHRQQLELTDDLLPQGHWGKEDAVLMMMMSWCLMSSDVS